MRHSVVKSIQKNDPSYDPIGQALCALRTDDVPGYRRARAFNVLDPEDSRPLRLRDYVDAAHCRVSCDGYYGPLRNDDWAEQDGRRPYDVGTSLDVLAAVSDAIEDYQEYVYVGDDDNGEPVESLETVADAQDIRRDVFGDVVRIYGELPW